MANTRIVLSNPVESLSAVEFIYCECKCGFTRSKYDDRGRIRTRIKGHSFRGKQHSEKSIERMSIVKRGENHNNWKGGRLTTSQGYIMRHKPDHLFHDKNGYVAEHRLVYEEYHKCCLLPWTDIHHIDNNQSNNIISNLKPLSRSNHTSEHMKLRYQLNIPLYKKIDKCQICNKITYIRKCGRPDYYTDPISKTKIVCHNCYRRHKKLLINNFIVNNEQ